MARLRWSHRTLNFPNVPAQELAPLQRLSTDEDRRDNRRREHRLGIAEMDEEAIAPTLPAGHHQRARVLRAKEGERDKRRAE